MDGAAGLSELRSHRAPRLLKRGTLNPHLHSSVRHQGACRDSTNGASTTPVPDAPSAGPHTADMRGTRPNRQPLSSDPGFPQKNRGASPFLSMFSLQLGKFLSKQRKIAGAQSIQTGSSVAQGWEAEGLGAQGRRPLGQPHSLHGWAHRCAPHTAHAQNTQLQGTEDPGRQAPRWSEGMTWSCLGAPGPSVTTASLQEPCEGKRGRRCLLRGLGWGPV